MPQIDLNTFLWSIINILVMVLIVYSVYLVVRNITGTTQQQRKNEKTIITKLDEVIEQNKKITEEISKK